MKDDQVMVSTLFRTRFRNGPNWRRPGSLGCWLKMAESETKVILDPNFYRGRTTWFPLSWSPARPWKRAEGPGPASLTIFPVRDLFSAGIFKQSMGARNRVWNGLSYRQATHPGGIGSLESILGLFKSLKIRAQASLHIRESESMKFLYLLKNHTVWKPRGF